MVLARKWCLLSALGLLLPRTTLAADGDMHRHYDLGHTEWSFLLGESLVAGSAYAGAWLITGGPRSTCNWCRTNAFDESIRGALRAEDTRPVAYLSHALSVGAVPVLALTALVWPAGLDERWDRGIEDSWIVANTFLATSAVGETVKHWVARQRPVFTYSLQDQSEFASWPSERNKSFFSLDTAWAFAIASSATTLAYLRGYSTAPYVAVGGAALATSAGMLRIVADAHWATDVITGAFVGTGIGIAMPLLLHRRQPEPARNVAVSPVVGGGHGVSLAFVF